MLAYAMRLRAVHSGLRLLVPCRHRCRSAPLSPSPPPRTAVPPRHVQFCDMLRACRAPGYR
eukprot:449348-Rhodomonas_salina.1